ncbi:hypothetical protein [Actinomadura sp. 6N118]|uniref:hypothetical protein n=1 Tax=Actinomadura sp. 6N118 TaxID=3375151 RepID=UPI0037B1E8D6
MSREWERLQAERAAWHRLLARIAGRVPDGALAHARWLLAEGRLQATAATVSREIFRAGIGLPREDRERLEQAMLEQAMTDEGLRSLSARIPADPADPMPRHVFTPGPPGGSGNRAEYAAVQAMREEPGAIGLWRVWRLPPPGKTLPVPRRVFVIEADDAVDLPGLTHRTQDRLSAAREVQPQVESYHTGEWLPAYQRSARANGELLWAREPHGRPRVAPVADGFALDPATLAEPYADLADEERDRLVAYLEAGEPVLLTPTLMLDVVERERGRVVPMSYRTDGTWVWSDMTTYYCREHGLWPTPALVEHIRAAGYRPRRVDGVALSRALDALYWTVDADPPGEARR